MAGTGTPFVGRLNAMSSSLSAASVLFVTSSSSLSSTMLLLLSAALLLGHATGAPKGYDYDVYDDAFDPFNSPNVVKIKKVVDYYSKPSYAFGYEVDDYYSQLSHGRWEIREGDTTHGQYRVLLPDVQIVSYIADKQGYRATVEYVGKGAHLPPPPAYANLKIPKLVESVPIVPIIASPAPAVIPSAFPVIADPFVAAVPKVKAHLGFNFATAIPPVIQDYHPVKIKVNSLPVNGPFPTFDPYAAGHGYGLDPVFAASSHNKISRKRALLYDRTLFRKDVETRSASRKTKN